VQVIKYNLGFNKVCVGDKVGRKKIRTSQGEDEDEDEE
jgi:hypothetical protein